MKRILERTVLHSSELAALVAPLLEDGRTVPLLVVRLPEFSEAAWRKGKRIAQRLERATGTIFKKIARDVVREEDLLAHDAGTDWFAIAMLAPARNGATFTSLDARAALERIAAGISVASGRRVETGWHPLAQSSDLAAFPKTVERALERGVRERERYEFLATIGHELRTPLTSIRGYIETLLDGEADAATTRRFLQTARNEALRLGRFVDGMLDFSLLDLSPVAARSGVADLTRTITSAVDALSPIAAESKIRIAVELAQPLFGRIDADACMHAVLNLLENALKYGRSNGRIRVTAERVDPYIRISFDDDGPGVAIEEREAIFTLRKRGNATVARPGRGLGLAIVRTIAERAGGGVWIESSPLGGARFVLQVLSVIPETEAEPLQLSS